MLECPKAGPHIDTLETELWFMAAKLVERAAQELSQVSCQAVFNLYVKDSKTIVEKSFRLVHVS